MNLRRLMFWRSEPDERSQKGAELIELAASSSEAIRHARAVEKSAKEAVRLGSYHRVSARHR